MPSAEHITLRLIDPREIEDALIRLHAVHFTSCDSEAKRKSYLDWLLSNPMEGSLYLAAYVDGQFASFLGFMARRVIGFGREYRAALAFGAMTQPEFAGRGLYRRLAHMGWEEAQRRGFDVALGYTTRRHVLEMELRMGWRQVAAAPVVALPLDCEAVVRAVIPRAGPLCALARPLRYLASAIARSRSSRALQSTAITQAHAFAPAYDVFADSLRKESVLSFSKDCRTLSWLYLSPHNPFEYDIAEAWHDEKLVGFAVGREMDLLGVQGYGIMDLLCLPGEEAVLPSLAAQLVQNALEKKSKIVAALVSEHHAARRALRGLGFMSSGTRFSLILRPVNEALPLPNFLHADNWCNLWGNNDTV